MKLASLLLGDTARVVQSRLNDAKIFPPNFFWKLSAFSRSFIRSSSVASPVHSSGEAAAIPMY